MCAELAGPHGNLCVRAECVGRSRETLDCFRSEQPVNRGCVYKSIIVYKCPVGERSLCCVRRAACIVGFVLYEKNVHQPWPLALKCVSIGER